MCKSDLGSRPRTAHHLLVSVLVWRLKPYFSPPVSHVLSPHQGPISKPRQLHGRVLKNAFCSNKSYLNCCILTQNSYSHLLPGLSQYQIPDVFSTIGLMKFRATIFSPTHRTIFKTYVNVLFCSLLLNLLLFNIHFGSDIFKQKKKKKSKCHFQENTFLNTH